jgi:hypothetical protein
LLVKKSEKMMFLFETGLNQVWFYHMIINCNKKTPAKDGVVDIT